VPTVTSRPGADEDMKTLRIASEGTAYILIASPHGRHYRSLKSDIVCKEMLVAYNLCVYMLRHIVAVSAPEGIRIPIPYPYPYPYPYRYMLYPDDHQT
jgi:hypothetical protein